MATSSPDTSGDERERLRTLSAYELDTVAVERDLSYLVHLAARIFDTPMALVSVLDRDRQRIQARYGAIRVRDTDRDVSFCNHALARPGALVVPDTLKDERFWSNPYVLGEPYVRFYAGWPLVAFDGQVLGALCVLDVRPRPPLSAAEQDSLRDIAGLVMSRMELRRLDRIRLADEARFESIAATSPDAIVLLDGQDRVSYWNASATRLFACSAAHIVGRPVTGILHPTRIEPTNSGWPGFMAKGRWIWPSGRWKLPHNVRMARVSLRNLRCRPGRMRATRASA